MHPELRPAPSLCAHAHALRASVCVFHKYKYNKVIVGWVGGWVGGQNQCSSNQALAPPLGGNQSECLSNRAWPHTSCFGGEGSFRPPWAWVPQPCCSSESCVKVDGNHFRSSSPFLPLIEGIVRYTSTLIMAPWAFRLLEFT